MSIALSLIIPTRERASYLEYALRSCTDNPEANLEIVVLDNASQDQTPQLFETLSDPRVRYLRSDIRLSMRDNFERGLQTARGEIVGFIGDDDGVLPFTVARVLEIFRDHEVEAIAAARANYFWPDLLSGKRNMALLPRWHGLEVLDSRVELRRLLTHGDYYRLPCLYHGFVRRSLVERLRQRQGRFFLANQVDMFSSIALSMESVRYAFSHSPLVINGTSPRSNGASHYGAGGGEREKQLWKQEDDLGFLSGFTDSITIPAAIIESALRYCMAYPGIALTDIFEPASIRATLLAEVAARFARGRRDDWQPMFEAAGVDPDVSDASTALRPVRSPLALLRAIARARPIDMDHAGVNDVAAASHHLAHVMRQRRFGLAGRPWEEFQAGRRLRSR